ncbi:hypothetical protein AMJ80_10620, partial [bacterium SM23_31]
KTRQQYRIDAQSDSLNIMRQQLEDRPTYTTPKGRTVYGGGGITPDIEISMREYNLLSWMDLSNNNPNDDPFFRYAQEYAVKNANKWDNADDFVKGYKLEGAELDNFIKFLKDNNINFNEQILRDEPTDLNEFWIRRYIAEFLWGNIGYSKSEAVDDNVLSEALKYFPEAEKLVKN